MKIALSFFFILFFYIFHCQNVKIVDNLDNNYQKEIYIPVTNFHTGEKMSDQKVDDKLYKKIDGQFYKKAVATEITPQIFGAKGDSKYRTKGDINQLQSGTDDTQAISNFLNIRNKTSDSGSKFGGSALYFPSSIYKTNGSFVISDSNTTLFGDASGSSIIHVLKNTKDLESPFLLFQKSKSGNTYSDLLTGGGLEKIALRTDNSLIRNYAINLVFAEYMVFRDLNIEGFGKSAIKGGFWESYFDNIKIAGCGALQTADKFGNPTEGIIDTSSDNPKRPDGSNNTLFNKLTFSSNYGTWLKLTSQVAQTVNFNINGFYGESYYGDAGSVDNLPIIYVSNSTGNSINGGFITVNSTGIERDAEVIRMNEISELKLSNLTITFNPIEGFLKRPVRKLRTIASLKTINAKLSLRDVVINDQVDGVGYGLLSTPPLIEGIGICTLSNATFNLLGNSSGGTRRITNIVDRNLKANGNIFVIPSDINGEVPSLRSKIDLNNGIISYYSNKLPSSIDTWAVGDKIIKTNLDSNLSSGWVCSQAGTSGVINDITGSIKRGTNNLLVNKTTPFLIGDWIKIAGEQGYNRIKSIEKNLLILEQASKQTISNSQITFYEPHWVELKCN